MNEYKKPSGVPWRFWGGFLVLGLLVFITYRLFPSSFEHSSPQLVVHGETVSVDFDATNRARTSVTKHLSVSIGTLRTGIKGSGPHYTPLKHQKISVSLAPSETKHIRCEFAAPERITPNAAEVTMLQ